MAPALFLHMVKPFNVVFLCAQRSIPTEDRPQGRVLGVHICGAQVFVGLAVKKIKETNANEENPYKSKSSDSAALRCFD